MKTQTTDITNDLRALPYPAPPSDLTAVVMARIARVDERTDPIPNAARARQSGVSKRTPEWSSWAALGGMAAGLAMTMPGYVASIDMTSLGRNGVFVLAATTPTAALSLVAAVAIYLAGLFLPLRQHRS